jgi:hypothetical protein
VGKFTGQGGSLEVGVEKPIHAKGGNFIEIGGTCGLQGGSAVKDWLTPVAEPVKQEKDAAHVDSLGQE